MNLLPRIALALALLSGPVGAQIVNVSPMTPGALTFLLASNYLRCDGATNDTTNFAALSTAINATGGGVTVVFPSVGSCFVWPQSGGTPNGQGLLNITVSGVTIEGNGATITTDNLFTGQGSDNYVIFLNSVNDIAIKDLKYIQSGLTTATEGLGPYFIFGLNSVQRLYMRNLYQVGGQGGVRFTRNAATRARLITLDGAYFEATYYPMSFGASGDDFTATNVVAKNSGRAYFPSNVQRHNVWLKEEYTGIVGPSVLIKTYADPTYTDEENTTSDIYLNYTMRLVSGTGVSLIGVANFQQAAAGTSTGFQRNITIDVDISGVGIVTTSNAITIGEKYTLGGAADATTRGYVVDNIVIRGKSDFPSGTVQFLNGFSVGTWTSETVRNAPILRNLVMTGNSLTSDITLNLSGILPFVSFENVTASKNITLTNAGTGVVRTINLKAPNINEQAVFCGFTSGCATIIAPAVAGTPTLTLPIVTGTLTPQTVASWTPVDSSGAGLTFTSVSAQYTQIGNIVFLYAALTYPATADGSVAVIGGLPVAVPNAQYARQCNLTGSSSTSTINFIIPDAGASTVTLFNANLGTVSNLQMTGKAVYFMCIYPAT